MKVVLNRLRGSLGRVRRAGPRTKAPLGNSAVDQRAGKKGVVEAVPICDSKEPALPPGRCPDLDTNNSMMWIVNKESDTRRPASSVAC